MKYLKFVLVFFLLQSTSVFAQADTDDVVGWSDVSVTVPLVKSEESGKSVDRLFSTFTGVFRMGRDLHRPIDQRIGASVTYRINKYFNAGSGYLYHRFRPTEAPVQYEHRVMFYGNAEKKFKNATLKNRSMFTYLIRNSNSNAWVFRNRTQVIFPIRKKGKEIFSLYVADEPFYNFKLSQWVRNDVHVGVTKQFTKAFASDFYFVHQSFVSGAIRRTNGFGVSFRYRWDIFKK